MAKERLSKLQKHILKTLSEVTEDYRNRGLSKEDDVPYGGYPSLSISGHLNSKVSDRYYDELFNTGGMGARFLKNVVISRKASVAISRSLRNLHRKGLVILYEISGEARLTAKGADVARKI
jgi:hypothetical protein